MHGGVFVQDATGGILISQVTDLATYCRGVGYAASENAGMPFARASAIARMNVFLVLLLQSLVVAALFGLRSHFYKHHHP